MSVQNSFTFYPNTVNEVDWTLTDVSGNMVNNASMVLTLYWGRDRIRPDLVPGIAVPNVSNVTMGFASQTNAYSAQFTFSPSSAPIGGDYMLVVDATQG